MRRLALAERDHVPEDVDPLHVARHLGAVRALQLRDGRLERLELLLELAAYSS